MNIFHIHWNLCKNILIVRLMVKKTLNEYRKEVYALRKQYKTLEVENKKHIDDIRFLLKQRRELVTRLNETGSQMAKWRQKCLVLEDKFKYIETELITLKEYKGEKNNGRRKKTKRKSAKNSSNTRRKRRS